MGLSNIPSKLKLKIYNRNVTIFLVFLLLALFVWFLNKLSYDYLYTIEYPVRLYSTKNKQIVFNDDEITVTVQQRMSGFSILKSKASKAPAISLDLNTDRYYKVPATPNTYYLLTKSFTEIIDQQIGDERHFTSIYPDTLFFTIGVLAEKKVPVKHQLNFSFEKEYMVRDSIFLVPDSVTIVGSKNEISEVPYVMGNPKSLQNLSKPVEGSFDLIPIRNIHFSSNQVHYSADIIRYTEGNIKTSINVQNLPSGISITLLPSEVEVRYKVALSDFSALDTSLFITSVNYNDIVDNSSTLEVQVARQPKEVLSTHITPPFVEYIIRKN